MLSCVHWAGSRTTSTPASAPAAPATKATDGSGREGDSSDFKLPDLDLQRVHPSVVVATKKVMDVVFEANRLKPGDPGYVYNVEVEFEEGHESNEWDEDD